MNDHFSFCEALIRRTLVLALLFAAVGQFSQVEAQQSEQQRPNTSNHQGPIKVDPSYSRIANETGGQVYVMDRTQIDQMSKVATLTSLGEHDPLLSINDNVQGTRTLHADVSGDVERLVVSVTGTKDFDVRRPNGSVVGKQENIVQYVEISNGSIYSIEHPESGPWTLSLRASGTVAVRVSAVRAKTSDTVQFDRFEFVEIAGRPGHEGMFPIQGYPLAGHVADVEAALDGEVSLVQFEFRSPGGELLRTVRLQKIAGNSHEYAGRVTVPEVPFVVYAVGVDMHGARFQRLRSAQVNPQSFRVSAPRYWELKTGEESTCQVEVANYGPPGSFRVIFADAKHLVRDFAPKTFHLDTNGSVTLALRLHAESGAASSEDLVISVQRTDTDQNNFAMIHTTTAPE